MNEGKQSVFFLFNVFKKRNFKHHQISSLADIGLKDRSTAKLTDRREKKQDGNKENSIWKKIRECIRDGLFLSL